MRRTETTLGADPEKDYPLTSLIKKEINSIAHSVAKGSSVDAGASRGLSVKCPKRRETSHFWKATSGVTGGGPDRCCIKQARML